MNGDKELCCKLNNNDDDNNKNKSGLNNFGKNQHLKYGGQRATLDYAQSPYGGKIHASK